MKKPLWVVAILATVASIVANLIIMFLAKPFGPDFLILDTAAVTIFSIGGTVGATIAFLIVKIHATLSTNIVSDVGKWN